MAIKASFKKILGGFQARNGFKHANDLNTLPFKTLTDLIQFSESRLVQKTLSHVTDKRVLLLAHRYNYFLAGDITAKNPKALFELEIEEIKEPRPEGFRVRIDPNHWPLVYGAFDSVYLPLANSPAYKMGELLGEASRLMPNGSRLFVTLMHPQLEFILKNQNPASSEKASIQFENLFAQWREFGFFVEDIREARIDTEIRPYFTDEEEVYKEVEGTNVVAMLQAIRYQKV